MSERNEPGERSNERRPAEGVRIIGPEEAQAALDAGAAAGRRADDELRFGDVPPTPSGPRPRHRFPLPDSVDPADAVPRVPVVPPARVDPVAARSRPAVRAEDAHDPRPWHGRSGGADPGAGGAAGDPVAAADGAVTADDAVTTGEALTAGGEAEQHDAFAITSEQPVLDLTASAADPPAGAAGWPVVGGISSAAAHPEAQAIQEPEPELQVPVAPAGGGGPAPALGGEAGEPDWLRRARAPWPEARVPLRGEPAVDTGVDSGLGASPGAGTDPHRVDLGAALGVPTDEPVTQPTATVADAGAGRPVTSGGDLAPAAPVGADEPLERAAGSPLIDAPRASGDPTVPLRHDPAAPDASIAGAA
ncbi:MAG TPA: hypothetical protein VFP61_10195, partial [Acidimicrobiales bacterium]|nr:hypothetical protein [Acidimicrobiales bacterium]